MKRSDEERLVALIEKAISRSVNYSDSKLSKERRDVLQFYRGELPKQLHKGSSSYVSMDVFDAVDSMRAQLLETFSAHQHIVQYTPQGAEDVEPSRIATEYCAYVTFRQNDGPGVFYDAITDGLTSRYGITKVYYEMDPGDPEDREGLTEDDLVAIMSDASIEVESLEQHDDETGAPSYDVTFRRPKKKICLLPLPPEEFLIEDNSTSIQGATHATHRSAKRKQELLDMKYDPKKLDRAFADSSLWDDEKIDRFAPVNGGLWLSNDEIDEDNKLLYVHETYIKARLDGEYRLWKVVMVGREILEVEPAKVKPFAGFVPLPTPHTWFGDNYAANVIPTQKARTALVRSILDHTMITNNPRLQVLNGTVPNPAELMDNRLGGLVNVRRMDGIMPLPQAQLNPFVFETIGLLDDDKEERTGISRLSQGLNKDAISSQNSQAMVEQLISVSQTRQKIVARQFARYLVELYVLIYNTALQYIDHTQIADVAGNWVDINTENWIDRKDAAVDLALGYGEQEQLGKKLGSIYGTLSQDPALATQFGPQQRYELLRRGLRKMGIVDVESIVLPPDKAPPPQPDPAAQAEIALKNAQAKLMNAQAELTMAKAKAEMASIQNEATKVQLDATRDKADHDLDVREFEHKRAVDLTELALAQKAPEQRAVYAPNA